MKIFVTITTLILLPLSLCLPSWAEIYSEETEQAISFDNVYDIFVDNVDGDIEIKAVENLEEISVKVTKQIQTFRKSLIKNNQIDALDKDIAKDYAESLVIKKSREKDRIIYQTEAPTASPEGILSTRVNYQINAPQDIAVVIRNGRGNVKIEGITGNQDIGAANGLVELKGVIGRFQVTVIKGSIKGEIWLNGASEFSTTGGSIELNILDNLSFPLALEATDGHINLRLPAEYSADLEAQCDNGRVISEVPLTYEIEPQKSESILQGSLNDGGPLLKLSTSNGDITIQEIDAERMETGETPSAIRPTQPTIVEEPEVVDMSSPRPEMKKQVPSTEAVRTNIPPSIDGTLNERVWRNATHLGEFYLADGGTDDYEFTEAYLLWDEDNFYIGVKAYDPQMHKIKISQTEVDNPVWEDDDIELLLDPNPRTQQYYHIAVNPIGTIFDQQVLRHYDPKRLGSSVEKILRTTNKETDITWSSHCEVGTEI